MPTHLGQPIEEEPIRSRHHRTYQAPPRPVPVPTTGGRGLQHRPWSWSYRRPARRRPTLQGVEELTEKARGVVTRHPLTMLAVASVAGFLLGRR